MLWNWLKEKSYKVVSPTKPLKTSHSFLPEIQIYIERELQKRLGLLNIIPLEGHYQNALAQTKEGKIFINFFSKQYSDALQRSLFTHSLLQKHEIDVLELLWADTDPQNLEKYQVCCFATKWMSGKSHFQFSSEGTLAAFKVLGKIHAITLEHLTNTQQHFEKTCPLPILSAQGLTEKLRSIIEHPLTEKVVCLENATQAFSFLESGLTAAFSSLNAPVLLHRDFHPGNLLLRPDKTLVTLDFETSAFGPFFIDLSNSLLKFCHKSRAQNLDDIDFEERLNSSEMKILSQTYFTHAPQSARELWESSGSFFLFWAYLKILCQLTKKAALSSPTTNSPKQTTVQLQKRWNSVLKYVNRNQDIKTSLASK